MCNDYRLEMDIASIVSDFAGLQIAIRLPEGMPNVPARQDVRISDTAPIVRGIHGDRSVGDLVNRQWSWPGPGGKPVYNFRSEGREFTDGRCLILADGFYEFTDALPGEKRKTKWLFTLEDHPWFCIAGIWRALQGGDEAFTMLTTEPGADVKPYHHRQIVVLARDQWADWLDPAVPAAQVMRPLAEGSLKVTRVFPPGSAQPSLL